jgi:hypothetical protein
MIKQFRRVLLNQELSNGKCERPRSSGVQTASCNLRLSRTWSESETLSVDATELSFLRLVLSFATALSNYVTKTIGLPRPISMETKQETEED